MTDIRLAIMKSMTIRYRLSIAAVANIYSFSVAQQ